jgi:hypothetical protein
MSPGRAHVECIGHLIGPNSWLLSLLPSLPPKHLLLSQSPLEMDLPNAQAKILAENTDFSLF